VLGVHFSEFSQRECKHKAGQKREIISEGSSAFDNSAGGFLSYFLPLKSEKNIITSKYLKPKFKQTLNPFS